MRGEDSRHFHSDVNEELSCYWAKEALRLSEERFRSLVENINDMVSRIDPEGLIIYVSPAIERLIGYKAEEVIGHKIFEFIEEDDSTKATETLALLLKGEQPGTPLEYKITAKNGETVHLEMLPSPLRDDAGQIMEIVTTSRDITGHRRREEMLERLVAAGAIFAGTLALEPLLVNILAAAMRVIPAAEKGSIIMLDQETGELSPRALSGYKDPRVWGVRFICGSGYAKQAMKEQRPLLIDDVQANPAIRYDGEVEEIGEIRSAIVAPLLIKGRPVGVISLDNTSRKKAFNADDLQALTLFTDQAALAIENAMLFEVEQRRADGLELLFEAAQATATTLELDHILQWLVETLGRRFEARLCSICLFNPREQAFEIRAIRAGDKDMYTPKVGSKIPVSHSPALQQMIENKTTIFVSDFDEESKERWREMVGDQEWEVSRQNDIHSGMIIPLIHRGDLLGAITLRLHESIPYIPLEEQILTETVAGHAASAIANARLYQQTQRRNLALQTLHQVSLDISSRLDSPDLLQTITEKAIALLGGDAGGFYLYNPDRDELVYSGACGHSKDFVGTTIKPGQGLAGQSFLARRTMVVDNFGAGDRQGEVLVEDSRDTHVVAVPLIGKQEVLGVLVIDGVVRTPTLDEDTWLLELFAAQATIALNNARLHQNSIQLTEELRHVYDLSLALGATLDEREIMRLLAHSAREVTGATISHVYIRDDKTGEFLSQVDSDDPERWAPPPLIPPRPHGLTVWIMDNGRPLNIPETSLDPRVKPRLVQVGLHSTIGVPLMREGRAIGALFVNGERPNQFAPRQIDLLSILASQAAIAIENARLVDRLVKSERLTAIGQIGVTIQHELNNALTPVMGNADYLLQRESENLSPDGQEALSCIVKETQRIRDLLKKLTTPEDRLKTYLGEVKMIDIS